MNANAFLNSSATSHGCGAEVQTAWTKSKSFRRLATMVGCATLFVLFSLTLGAQTTKDEKPATNQRGTIKGRVVSEDGQPLMGVGVYAPPRQSSVRSRSATTDDEGNFILPDLPLVSYGLLAQTAGYVESDDSGTNPLARQYRVGETVTLTLTKGGVITGKVLDQGGQPLVGANVTARRVRDSAGRAVNNNIGGGQSASDDRGIYRIYGLQTGSYVVYTNGSFGTGYVNQTRDVPTYYPSSPRDAAQEVPVTVGLVVTGIDIRHRRERGHSVSGTFTGVPEGAIGPPITITLSDPVTKLGITSATVNPRLTNNGFAVNSVPDGEYEITASHPGWNAAQGASTAPPRTIKVQGSDVTGVVLNMLPLGSIVGRVELEPSALKDCPMNRRGTLTEIVLHRRRLDFAASSNPGSEVAPNDQQEFIIPNVAPGRYRLTAQLPSDHWYWKAMTAPTPAGKPIDAARQDLLIKQGEKLAGLTLTMAEGAAAIRTRVEGRNLPARLRVLAVPAEKEAADDVLRYVEVMGKATAPFTLAHLAPGKYWLLVRSVPDEEADEQPAPPAAWNAEARAKLRREAEAANQSVEVKPCQRVTDYVLKVVR